MGFREARVIHRFYNKKTGEAEGVVKAYAPEGINLTVDEDCWIDKECHLYIVSSTSSLVNLRLSKVQIKEKSKVSIDIGRRCEVIRFENVNLVDASVLSIDVTGSCTSIKVKDYYSIQSDMFIRNMDSGCICLEDIYLVENSKARLRSISSITVKDLRMIESSRLEIGTLVKPHNALMYRPNNLLIESVNMEDESELDIRIEVTDRKNCEESASGLILKGINMDSESRVERLFKRLDSAIFEL